MDYLIDIVVSTRRSTCTIETVLFACFFLNRQRLSLARNIESQRRPERRSRSIKAAYVIDAAPSGTFCGTDSGYITGDDQKKNEVGIM